MQHGLLKWLDPVLLIGLFISIAVATGMIVLGNDTVQSFIVGLLSTIIALLVDIITRIQRTEYSVLEATRLSQIVSDENISPFLLRVAQHYHNRVYLDYGILFVCSKRRRICQGYALRIWPPNQLTC